MSTVTDTLDRCIDASRDTQRRMIRAKTLDHDGMWNASLSEIYTVKRYLGAMLEHLDTIAPSHPTPKGTDP